MTNRDPSHAFAGEGVGTPYYTNSVRLGVDRRSALCAGGGALIASAIAISLPMGFSMRMKLTDLTDGRRPWRELPFSSPLSEELRAGEYLCVTCGSVLFKSAAKFFTSSGWPTFSRDVDGALKLTLKSAQNDGVFCNCIRCQCYIGEVFFDGPAPSKRRYVANGKSLVFRTSTHHSIKRA